MSNWSGGSLLDGEEEGLTSSESKLSIVSESIEGSGIGTLNEEEGVGGRV